MGMRSPRSGHIRLALQGIYDRGNEVSKRWCVLVRQKTFANKRRQQTSPTNGVSRAASMSVPAE
jgi:hypothetical protein